MTPRPHCRGARPPQRSTSNQSEASLNSFVNTLTLSVSQTWLIGCWPCRPMSLWDGRKYGEFFENVKKWMLLIIICVPCLCTTRWCADVQQAWVWKAKGQECVNLYDCSTRDTMALNRPTLELWDYYWWHLYPWLVSVWVLAAPQWGTRDYMKAAPYRYQHWLDNLLSPTWDQIDNRNYISNAAKSKTSVRTSKYLNIPENKYT